MQQSPPLEWTLYARTENPHRHHQTLTPREQDGQPSRHTIPTKDPTPPNPMAPKQYDTGLTPKEDLWTRKGWADKTT